MTQWLINKFPLNDSLTISLPDQHSLSVYFCHLVCLWQFWPFHSCQQVSIVDIGLWKFTAAVGMGGGSRNYITHARAQEKEIQISRGKMSIYPFIGRVKVEKVSATKQMDSKSKDFPQENFFVSLSLLTLRYLVYLHQNLSLYYNLFYKTPIL